MQQSGSPRSDVVWFAVKVKDYMSAHHSTCSPFLSICSKSSQNRSRSSCLLQPSACQALGAETETQQATSHHLSRIKSWKTQKKKYSCVFLHRWKMEKSHTTTPVVIVILSEASQLLLLVQPYLVNKTSLLGGCANKIWTKMKAHEGHLPTFEEWTIEHTTIETDRCTWCSYSKRESSTAMVKSKRAATSESILDSNSQVMDLDVGQKWDKNRDSLVTCNGVWTWVALFWNTMCKV